MRINGYGGSINDVRVKDTHFAYLRRQRGQLYDLKDDKFSWAGAYRVSLLEDFGIIKPELPLTCYKFLDVGSGLGGLDIVVWRYYTHGRGGTEAWLLDGKDDKVEDIPEHPDHDETFSNEAVARDFWLTNQAVLSGYVDAANPIIPVEVTFDLVLSTRSWGFHFEPNRYLDLVMEHVHRDTVIILDMRRDRPKWIHQLERYLKALRILREGPKYSRIVWRQW